MRSDCKYLFQVFTIAPLFFSSIAIPGSDNSHFGKSVISTTLCDLVVLFQGDIFNSFHSCEIDFLGINGASFNSSLRSFFRYDEEVLLNSTPPSSKDLESVKGILTGFHRSLVVLKIACLTKGNDM